MLTATKWSTEEEKGAFIESFKSFVLQDFPRKRFSKPFYRRLCQMFGFIAHYDCDGFYDTYFTSLDRKANFIESIAKYTVVGDPAWTWSDVEEVIKQWIKDEGITRKALLDKKAELEAKERAELSRLIAKYGVPKE